MLRKNAIVGQSGGPTSVINSSLAGVIDGCIKAEEIDRVYGAVYGIEGVLNENIIDLTDKFSNEDELKLLKVTPASYLGSCRRKLKDEFKEIFDVFEKYDIGYFFYIGGNDSMDTVMKLSHYAKDNNIPVKIVGVPKTIDNDLEITDHTPGFGSAAKFVATTIKEIAHDADVYDKTLVTIIETMGRNAGWLTAASALARDGIIDAPHLIYLPEIDFDVDKFIVDIVALSKTRKNIVVVVSEGISDKNGEYILNLYKDTGKDAFGHTMLSGVCGILADIVKKRTGFKVKNVEFNIMQRCCSHIGSKTDCDEAFEIGAKGVEAALNGETGCMVYFSRTSDSPYACEIKSISIDKTANAVKLVPKEWITKEQNDVTKEFIEYALPLIQGETEITYENGVPKYTVR